jgi:stage V sporulation protein R
VDLLGERHLHLEHKVAGEVLLDEASCDATLRHVRALWGYKVSLAGVDAKTGAQVYERSIDQA